MGIESLTIKLDDSSGVFVPGQEVCGKVCVTNLSSKILKGIYLECQGYSKFCFNELNSETFYSSEETYLDLKIPLIHNEGGNRFELVSGDHQFPFSFVLPTKIPSSFQTEMLAKFGFGYVRYSIKVVLKRSSKQNNCETCHIIPFSGALKPSWKPNYEHMIVFTVRSIVDLNSIPKAAMPSQTIRSKTVFRWGCCRSGYINVKVWVDRTGYVPGETILCHVNLENQSRTSILGSTVSFIESVDFHTHNKSKTYERVLCELKHRDWSSLDSPRVFPIVVPAVTPSHLQYCDIIDVSYKIEFRLVDSEALASKFIVPLDILVGNVPFRPCVDPNPPELLN